MAGPRSKAEQLQKIIFWLLVGHVIWPVVILKLSSNIDAIPREMTVDVPPDLNMGITRKLYERDPAQVHGYAYMIHELINSWDEIEDKKKLDISTEEKRSQSFPVQLVSDYRCYITQEFEKELTQRRENYVAKGEYIGQARYSNLIPDLAFSDKNVYSLGDSWVVDLPVTQTEYYNGTKLYSRDISVKYRVIRGESRAINCHGAQWNFQLAGFYEEPKTIIRNSVETQ
ncbi:hypothetical protein A1QO_00600 [Vibrio genomosp. F10 str. ZF-129]|uniref:Integrating conjugative element protein n=1 Tax=Vibrio genomosp. F10 str. ZF-129 TaxID=1187848 RepID=A0A1E5BG87_9VIBR|nr:DUF2895 family protein [Vibrio genomosp. F10]OEE35291.1 hypothetical protein A1QO_00600 [Vibrio genomosp. F10 str. ZF-129]